MDVIFYVFPVFSICFIHKIYLIMLYIILNAYIVIGLRRYTMDI
jgi:hypothetical protein